ncbi:MAG: ABC transporter ATP-binding protein [Spongiibacteraceae bacterium]
MNNLRFLYHYLVIHKYSYLLGVLALLATNWLAVSIPVHIGRSIDLLGGGETRDELFQHVYLVIGFAVAMIFTRTMSRMLFFNPGRAVERDLKNDAFSKLIALQSSFYKQHQVGTLISIVNNDINGVRAMAGVGMMSVCNIFFALSFTPFKMWKISPVLMMYCVVPVVIAFLIVNYSIAIMRRLMRKRMAYLQTLSANTINLLNGIDVIKSHQIQGWAVTEFQRVNQQLLDCSMEQLKVRTFFMPILEYTDGLLKILILAIGGSYLIEQSMSLGELTAFLAYATLLAIPFISLGRIISTFQMGMISLQSICRIFNEPVEVTKQLASKDNEALFSKGIFVRNLSYSYPDKAASEVELTPGAEPLSANMLEHNEPTFNTKPILNNISFDILPGQKIALLGKVGCGKTTLVNCLNRYLDIPAGHVFIDQHDITELALNDVRSAIRTITQEPFLFSDSVSNNVQFGSSEYEDKLSLDEALYHSAMRDEVAKFPEQENTLVGEKGILLSGGQKQRLSLARGMFTPCKLIILDNVLSAVDNETEQFLLTQIFENMRSQSCLLISHRPAVLERVDTILMMEAGEIVASGNHHQLLASSNLYRQTWGALQKDHESGGERSPLAAQVIESDQ